MVSTKIKIYKLICIALLIVLFQSTTHAQQTIVLPNNSNYSKEASPQGALHYQRAFYLIKAGEIKKSGLVNGNSVNGIGFTYSTAQNVRTKGAFKIYLQNTNDNTSRVDTSWITRSSNSDSLFISSGLFSGQYEWKIRTKNGNNYSVYSDTLSFNNDNLKSCQSPTRLRATNIDSTSVTFNWDSPSRNVLKYYLEYRCENSNTTNWTTVLVTGTSYQATGLIPNKTYRWHVKSYCSLTDSSVFNENLFSTNYAALCNGATFAISSGFNAIPTDTGVVFKWTKSDSALNYSVRYRRVGSLNWAEMISFDDSFSIQKGLFPGTTYEWQVRANCVSGPGVYSILNQFSTTGTTKLYPPINLSVNKLTDSSVILKWDGDRLIGNTFEISYRLKKTISWQHAIANMTNVYNDSITIPIQTGPFNMLFNNGNTFNYTGGGVYVAWEYNQSGAQLSTPNYSLCTNDSTNFKNNQGIYSESAILGFSGKNNFNGGGVKLQDTLTSNDFRPETRFISPNLRDSVEVIEVFTLGKAIPKFQSTIPISALITNKSFANKQFSVTVKVKESSTGVLRYTETKNMTIASGDTSVLVFNSWGPKFLETDSIIVSIPQDGNENILNNNSKAYTQILNATTISYADDNFAAFSVGSRTNAGGLLLNRYRINDSAKIIAAQVYLTAEAVGHYVYAVVCDSGKRIVAQSSGFIPQQKDINQYIPFYFSAPISFNHSDFYIGLAQAPSSDKFSPIGSQWEGTKPRAQSYYIADLNGSAFVDSPHLGRLMIKAQLVSSTQDCFIDGKNKLCAGGSLILTAGTCKKRYANRIISFSSQRDNEDNNNNSAEQILGVPDVFPNSSFAPGAWFSQQPDNRNEFLELGFPDADSINFIDIYEIQNAGAVDSVFTKNPVTSNYDLVWAWDGDTSAPEIARKKHIKLNATTAYAVNQVKITLRSDTSKGGVSGYNSIDAIAIGKEILPANAGSYTWMPGGQTSSSITVNTPGTYVLTAIDPNGHLSKDSIVILTTIPVKPKILMMDSMSYPPPKDTFCFGDSIRLTSDKTTGNIWNTGSTSKYITVMNSSLITLTQIDENGCTSLISDTFLVTVNSSPIPSVDVSNGGKICPGKSVILSTAPLYNYYNWSNGSTLSEVNIFTPGNYYVKVKDTITGCIGTSDVVNIRSVQNPDPVISGILLFCPNDSTILSVAASNISSYLWSNGSTLSSNVIKSPGIVNVTVTNDDGCSASTNAFISLLPKPMPSIIGKAKICPGETITISCDNGNYSSYLWTPGNLTNQTIAINDSGTYTLSVTDTNGCSNSIKKSIPYAPLPQPIITGTNSIFQFCPGTSIALNAGAGYDSYLWSNGQRSSSILVDRASTYSVEVKNSFGCKGRDTVTTSLNGAIPVTPGPISGQSVASCDNSNYSYSIDPINNTSYYTWIVPPGATIVSGQGSTSVVIKFGPLFKRGNIEVAASNTCGQSPSIHVRNLFVKALTDMPGRISGITNGICNASTISYSITPVPGSTSYTWTVPSTASITSGAGNNSINVTFLPGFNSGNVCVTANNACGSSQSSCLFLSGTPQVPAIINGYSNVCKNQRNLMYNISPVAGATSYTWTVPQSANIVAGQGTPNLVVNMGPQSGTITVKANSLCGSSAAQVKDIVVSNCVMSQNNTTLFNRPQIKPIPEVVSNYGGFTKTNKLDLEWTLGETFIKTEEKPLLIYTQGFHQPLNYIKIPANEASGFSISDLLSIKVYPNPVSSVLKLQFETTENLDLQSFKLQIQDVYGRTIKSKAVQSDNQTYEIDMTSVMSGSYFLLIRNENGSLLRTIKIVKTN